MKLKKKLADPDRCLSTELCTIPSAVVAQAIASAGADFIVIDQEHGAVDREKLHAMIAATAGTDCAPLVRIAEMSDAHVKVALDMGAEGIVFPLVRTPEDVQKCVASLRYPPNGVRGWGPFIGHSRWQVPVMEYLQEHGEDTVCGLLIETAEAMENIEEIFSVEGVDFAIVAQFDLSISMGLFGQFDHPEFLAAVAQIETAAKKTNVPLGRGPVGSKKEAEALFDKGYRIIGGFDVLRLKAAVATSVEWAKRGA